MNFQFLRKTHTLSGTSIHRDQGGAYVAEDEKVFIRMLKQAKANEQIIIHLNEKREFIYYLYARQIGHGWLGIGVKHSEVCDDLCKLHKVFDQIVSLLGDNKYPIIVAKGRKHGMLRFVSQGFNEQWDDIMVFKEHHRNILDSAFKTDAKLEKQTWTSEILNYKRRPFRCNFTDLYPATIKQLILEEGFDNICIDWPRTQCTKVRIQANWLGISLIAIVALLVAAIVAIIINTNPHFAENG